MQAKNLKKDLKTKLKNFSLKLILLAYIQT